MENGVLPDKIAARQGRLVNLTTGVVIVTSRPIITACPLRARVFTSVLQVRDESDDAPPLAGERRLTNHPVVTRPVGRPHHFLVHLAYRRQRQLTNEFDALGSVRWPFPFFDELHEALGSGMRTRLRYYECADGFAPFGIRDADYASHCHVRMNGKRIFDIAGIDIKPATHYHVLLAIKDVEVSFLIGASDIARVKPTIPEQSFRFLRPLPVLADRMRCTHANLPRLTGRNLLVKLVQDLDIAAGDRNTARGKQLRPVPIVVGLAQHR